MPRCDGEKKNHSGWGSLTGEGGRELSVKHSKVRLQFHSETLVNPSPTTEKFCTGRTGKVCLPKRKTNNLLCSQGAGSMWTEAPHSSTRLENTQQARPQGRFQGLQLCHLYLQKENNKQTN